ncbi:MAG: lytic murein transglycosylase, partial [Ewingella sp.]|nr:lytic murein transglycosylase [Ewingella sp.]
MKLSVLAVLITSVTLSGCAKESVATPASPAAQAPAAQAPAAEKPAKTMLAEQGRDPAEFPGYVEQLKTQARQQGISQATIDSAFANVHFIDRVINSDRNQLEKKITLDDYLKRVLPEAKIEQGRINYQQNLP